ncbi:Uncharacterized membrane protein [Halomicrobium zhouii]|uniref:Uncharacterized membrane protein n=1 Tax=Halomicrobium zhouii TaxID=767519 RepID=A0A1I6KE53_9EURY|nr:DUF502 domain-containing protein [Halomicrobium zhouii]SFR89555.1 Uncharacterized membrane protein [Halomicrobium zhouii]
MAATSWKRDFASGLIILLPILVSLYVLAYLYGILAGAPFSLVIDTGTLRDLNLPSMLVNSAWFLTFVRVMTTLSVFILLVFSIGYLMRTAMGDYAEGKLDELMNQLPGLRVVYNASKMAVETAVSGTEDLQAPVKLEPWNGMRMTAFKTGKSTPDGRDLLFLPTAPNITSGYVIEVEPENYEEIEESVEDALTRILSAGFGDTDDDTPPMTIGVGADDADDD